MSFPLVPKSVTLNDLERRNGVILRYFSEFGQHPGALRKSSRSLSHLLMSSCTVSDCMSVSAMPCGRSNLQQAEYFTPFQLTADDPLFTSM